MHCEGILRIGSDLGLETMQMALSDSLLALYRQLSDTVEKKTVLGLDFLHLFKHKPLLVQYFPLVG